MESAGAGVASCRSCRGGSHRVGGCCWITWIRGSTSFTDAGFTSSSACGDCTRAGGGRPGQRVERMMVMQHGRDRAALALARRAGSAVLRQNKVQVPGLRFPDHPDRALSRSTLSRRADRRPWDAARMAERWYAACPAILHHQFQGRKRSSCTRPSDFQQTNTNQRRPERGDGGFTSSSSTGWCCPSPAPTRSWSTCWHEMVPSSNTTNQPRQSQRRPDAGQRQTSPAGSWRGCEYLSIGRSTR